eukprot:GFKZ01014536.1.p1 GENE.GFKZ01014536.1~~GFKZ01014536.1.p1  ORF type:complete len:641 (+),score=71.81 GFKZ01014536.1:228-1925(+)
MTSATPSSTPISSTTFPSLVFSTTFTEKLPRDPETANFTRQVVNASYSLVAPTNPSEDDISRAWQEALDAGQVRSPEQGEPVLEKALIAWSGDCATLFDLPDSYPTPHQEKEAIEVLGGFGTLWRGMKPYAMCYGGHQFGNWAGQLGDGRAISLGEYVNRHGNRWEIQLKGAGKTPYSRFADGRAVLRSSVREFLCSEAMHFLGVPTTRALSLVGTGAGVVRDMFYMGSPQMEPGAVVARVAPSFLRLGNFQLAAFRQDVKLLRETVDYAIEYHYPELKGIEKKYVRFVEEVARKNAKMVAMWQAVGFVHGVMNTDNFSILGLTIDYGPYGYLDAYDPEYTPNTTDLPGRRYKFGSQPQVAHWNILQFCKAMAPLCGQEEMQKVVGNFEMYYSEYYEDVMGKKLGLSKIEGEQDRELLQEFLDRMTESNADHTNTWRALAGISTASKEQDFRVWCESLSLFSDKETEELWLQWLEKYKARLERDAGLTADERVRVMNRANPVYILRNYMAQVAIEKAEKGDYSEVRRLYELLKRPYEEQEGMKEYTSKPPSWASRKGVCVNSCSS